VDKILAVIGVITATFSGATLPAMVIFFGDVTDIMVSGGNDDGACSHLSLPENDTITTTPM